MSVREVGANDYFDEKVHYYSNPKAVLTGRKFDWLMNTDFSSTKVDVTYAEAIALGALMGGVTGACVGTAVGGPIGAGVGAAIGVPAGAYLGYLYVNGLKIRFSLDEYEKYAKTQEGKEFADKLRLLYKNDESLAHLNCAISYEPVVDGVYVQGENKRIYERKSIEEIIDRTGQDPYTRKVITRGDLVPAGDHINYEASIACVSFLKKKKIELEKTQPLMAKGFDIIISDYKENFALLHEKEMRILSERKNTKKISYQEYASACKLLQEKYLSL
jgi:hypothetical protein